MGTTGSGKTTLGKKLAAKLNIPCADLDDLYWLPNWQAREKDDFEQRITQVISKESWILCGNYSKFHHITVPRATTIIWLDLPFIVLLWRIVKRGIIQSMNKETICNGNYQTRRQFFWLLKHIFKTYRRRKSRIAQLNTQAELIHIKTSKEARKLYEPSAR